MTCVVDVTKVWAAGALCVVTCVVDVTKVWAAGALGVWRQALCGQVGEAVVHGHRVHLVQARSECVGPRHGQTQP